MRKSLKQNRQTLINQPNAVKTGYLLSPLCVSYRSFTFPSFEFVKSSLVWDEMISPVVLFEFGFLALVIKTV